MKYMSTNEPDRFIIDKSIELVGDGDVLVLVPNLNHIHRLRRYIHSRGLLEFCNGSLGLMMLPLGNSVFFRSSRLVTGLRSISVRSLIILEPVLSVSRKLAIERTRGQLDPEIWRINGF